MKMFPICLLVLAVGACAHARTAAEYRSDTAKLVAEKDPDVKACYDRVLVATPGAAGTVTVHFVIERKTGKVADPKIDAANTTAPQEVSQCVLDILPSLTIKPGDRKRGEATWSWEFAAVPAAASS